MSQQGSCCRRSALRLHDAALFPSSKRRQCLQMLSSTYGMRTGIDSTSLICPLLTIFLKELLKQLGERTNDFKSQLENDRAAHMHEVLVGAAVLTKDK